MQDLAPEVVRRTEQGETRVAPEVVGAEFLRGFAAQPARLVRLWDETDLLALLLPEVAAMRQSPQPEVFHSEGGVLAHALLALKRLGDLEQPGAQERWGSPIPFRPHNLHTQLAALLHDVGKPPTIQYPVTAGDRIRFPEHEPSGARLAGEIVDRLRLSVFPRGDPLHVDRDRLIFLVGHHMICTSLDLERTKLATLERYFFTSEERGGELLSLIYADIAATVPPCGRPDFACYEHLLEKLRQVAGVIRAHQEERTLPHLLTGREIMALLELPAGPPVGRVKEALREQQLQGKLTTAEEARGWLRRQGREAAAPG
jgi:poly(A) polymerase